MAAALVQTGTALNVGGGTSGTITLTGVAAGSLLVVYADDIDGLGATFSVSDDQGNTWAQAVHNDNGGYTSSIHYCLNAAAGTTVITVTASTATAFLAQAQEYSGGTWTLDTTSSIDETSTTSHVCSASAAVIDTAGEDVVVCNSTTNDGGNFGTRTAGSGYTGLSSPTAQAFWQYQIFSTAQANERGAFTSANSKATAACIAAFKCVAGCSDTPCWWPCCTDPCGTGSETVYVATGTVSGSGSSLSVDNYVFDSWSTDTSMTAGHGRPWCASWSVVGTKGYIVAGFVSGGSENDTDEFSASAWTAKTDHPSPGRLEISGAADSGYGYLFFGRDGLTSAALKDTDQFDTAGNSWTSKTDGVTGKSLHGTNVVTSKFYTTCGTSAPGTGGSYLQDTDEYNPSGDSWASKTSAPSPARGATSSFDLSSKIYISGGTSGILLRDTDEYDVAGNSWASVSDITSPARGSARGAVLGSAGHMTGSASGTQKQNDEYVPDVWTLRTDLISTRNLHGAFMI